MSIIKRSYEISVWDDVLIEGKFVEKRLGVIGSDEMTYQGRALKPQLGRNINGAKTFQFEMYRFFVDNVTGERVENPFIGWLVSERKVKLKYKNKWYDFIVKDIGENSSTYLYTYKLEDAAVVELSKNGFGVILDEKKNNNLGTAKELAERVLEDTDWQVTAEVAVQKVEDALVILKAKTDLTVTQLLDQTDLDKGVEEKKTNEGEEGEVPITISDNSIILAFYSSCTNKPHRFQFIYVGNDLTKITKDKNGKINNANCQYYIEFEPSDYVEVENTPFFLPDGFELFEINGGNSKPYELYTDARAERYNFAHQAVYIPKLDRYVYKYTRYKDTRYGYYDSDYYSPTLIQNFVTNSDFDSTTGWIGTRDDPDGTHATVRNVYGYFKEEGGVKKFINSADEILSGTFKPDREGLAAYLEITLKDENSLVLNSGPFDNRIIIGNMPKGSEWILNAEIYDSNGKSATYSDGEKTNLWVDVCNFIYEDSDFYDFDGNFTAVLQKDENYWRVTKNSYTNENFKKNSQIRIAIWANAKTCGTYYIKKFEFFKRIKDNKGDVIYPDNYKIQSNTITNTIVKNTYKYFTSKNLDEATSIENLKFEEVTDTLSYSTYKPVYNIGAEKVRSVSAKESNYFNILQSIAETFGQWLEIDVEHNDDGSIKELDGKRCKHIRFKNYAGKNNYASFRYGVNLKDIQRTYASKDIVTKLIVKPNSNEHAKNGYCAIGRAGSNPSGEDYIYDFRYFNEKGLLNADDYLEDVYVYNEGNDPSYTATSGYYYKIKDLNTQIFHLNDEIILPSQRDLTQLESEYAVAKAGYDAAVEELREVQEDFRKLTGVNILEVKDENIQKIQIDKENRYGSNDKFGHISYPYDDTFEITNVQSSRKTSSGKYYIYFTLKCLSNNAKDKTIWITLYPKIILKSGNIVPKKEIAVEVSLPENIQEGDTNTQEHAVELHLSDFVNGTSGAYNKIQEYLSLEEQKKNFKEQKDSLEGKIEVIKKSLYGDKSDEDNPIAGALENLQTLKNRKTALNQAFFEKYSRFISEGTWIDEKYVDDDLYYADALSVMYNSCYPKVAYTINVLALSQLEGYEAFEFELGDTTYAEDYEFFGENVREEVVITEFIELLDEPDKDQIKVQNFKNQFQDLFQKITATVQQAQYSTGSYEKAVALAEASQARKQQFLSDALNSASARLSAAGQQSVIWDNTGITVTDVDKPSNQIRMIGGAILLKKQDNKGRETWTTAITSDGISASLINTGILNAENIVIMNAKEPVFRWDAHGISAYSYNTTQIEGNESVISSIDTEKFVRFDRFGVYGIGTGVDGTSWYPSNINEIDDKATFALTWDGLKVTGSGGGTAHIGKNGTNIIQVKNSSNNPTFTVDEEGNIFLGGNIVWGEGSYPQTSRDDFLGLLNKEKDGIYNEGGNILINATKIKTGVLQIGGTSKDNALFYANVSESNPEVKIAGGTVSNKQFKFGKVILNNDVTVSRPSLYTSKNSEARIINQVSTSYTQQESIGETIQEYGYKIKIYLDKIPSENITDANLKFTNQSGELEWNPNMWEFYTNYTPSSPYIRLTYKGTQLGSFYYDVTISYSYNADVAILEDGSTYLGTTQINGDLLPHNTCSIGKLNNPWNTLYIKNINMSGGVLTDFLPDKTNTRKLGNSSYKWSEIYSNTPTINTSDFNAKESIVQLTEKYQTFFDALEPVSYKFKINSSNRTHVGYIGQKVKQSLLEANLTTLDFAGYCEWEKEDKTIECGLRYSEFIALNTWQIQKLKPRMTTAEEKIQQLELEVAELKQELAIFKNQ